MTTPIRKIFLLMIAFIQILIPIFNTSFVYKDINFSTWTEADEYSIENTTVLEKNPDADFVILNLTDIQLTEGEAMGKAGDLAADTIAALIEQTNPDLITMTGDNAWGTIAYIALLDCLKQYDIPFATIMGNHDGQTTPSEAWCAYRLSHTENSLFEFGPEEMGFGNYIINIKQGDDIIHTLYMMDTHSNADFTREDGSTVSGYDHLWANQLDWYKWAVEGLADVEGQTIQSSVFFHIPVVEYADAWNAAYNEETGSFNPGYEDSFGSKGENVCSAPVNNGFFALCKELGSTKDIICGHDHVNDYSINYQGIRLTYGVKTAAGCYWSETKSGGTVIAIHADGTTTVKPVYIDPAALGYDAADFD